MWLFVWTACNSDNGAIGEHTDTLVVASGAALTRVSCERRAPGPTDPTARFGCLYRGSREAVATLLAETGAAPNPARTNVSWSPCVRQNTAVGVRLPGSDDWFTKDGVETYWPAASLPPHPTRRLSFGDLYALGDHVCIEVVETLLTN